jgi:4-aminobutyrate aminotransferase-like enzyme
MTAPVMINAYDPSSAGKLDPAVSELIARRERVLGQPYRLFYEEPVHFVRGAGVWLYDAAGNKYLDAYNNVPSVGHCHPRVVEAVARQAGQLNVHTRYLDEGIVLYAERLLRMFPHESSRLMLTCTGSEANDLALRIARTHTGGTGIIVTANAYHGITSAVAQISPSLGLHVPLGYDVRTVPAPKDYGGARDPGEVFMRDVEHAIADLHRHGIRPAALIVDTIFSSDGVFAGSPGFLAPAAEAIRAAGGLFIADEVQAGFGRLGTHMWGFMRHGISPDLVTLGKPMGNGYPLAGVAARPAVLDEFATKARYFNTFAGSPVACAAGMAVLDIIEDEQLMQNAHTVGLHLKEGFEALSKRHPELGSVRGQGLFLGVDLVSAEDLSPAPQLAAQLVNELRRRRILISASGPHGHVLKIRPPLPFTTEHADMLLAATDEAMKALTASAG